MTEKNSETNNSRQHAVVITFVICILLVALAAVVGYNLGQTNPFEPEPTGDNLELSVTSDGSALNLDDLRPEALVNLENGYARIRLFPNSNFAMPKESTLEAYLVDAGTVGDFGISSEVQADEYLSSTLSDTAVDSLYDQVPYALSLGRVRKVENDDAEKYYEIEFNTQNVLTPYDRLVVTLESDIAREDFDPRPGMIVFEGTIGDNLKSKKSLEEAKQNSLGKKE